MTIAPALLVVSELPTIAGDPLDWSHNAFAFSCDAVDSTSIADAMATVQDFYEHVAGAHPVGWTISPTVTRAGSGCHLKCYDISAHLGGTPHGSPVGLSTFTMPAGSGAAPMPEGVAIALSFHGPYGSDVEFSPGPRLGGTRPRARDRGRVFIGPVDQAGLSVDGTTSRASLGAGVRNIISASAAYMRDHPHGTCQWAVWSRTKADLGIVVGGWVDDRFDYQRRREDQGLVRTNW